MASSWCVGNKNIIDPFCLSVSNFHLSFSFSEYSAGEEFKLG
jgi:hypothetical protein